MKKVLLSAGIVLGLLLIVLVMAAYFIDEPLRQRTEARINSALDGYTVSIGKLDFHPIGFSIELEDSVIVQDAQPDPPIAEIPRLSASVNWRALLSGSVVADFQVYNPKFFINLKQSRSELQDDVAMEERGWQAAAQAIYPLKINQFAVHDGELTYTDEGPYKPLELRNVNLRAYNIRNVRSREGEYPSDVYVEAAVFDRGKVVVQGNADFLAEPHVAVKADIEAEGIDLNYFRPITERYNFSVRRGLLSGAGTLEYAKNTKVLRLPRLDVHQLVADYVHNKPDTAPTKELAKKADRTIREHSNDPGFQLAVNAVNIINGELGVINKASKPEYRLFVAGARIKIQNLSNQAEDGAATIDATGKFMNSGATRLLGRLRPSGKGPDFDLELAIEQTEMKSMNQLFRAYGNFDVVAGTFSFFSELAVRNGRIDGYVKPLFGEVKIYDPKQDRHRGLLGKLYEGLLEGLAWILENRPRGEVATTTRISGELSNPETSLWDIMRGLIENAFFRAILPGLERTLEDQGPARSSASRS